MLTIQNHAKQRLIEGGLSLGMGLRQARTADIGRIARSCGYDWLFIDMEHNSMSADMAAQISVAAADAGITPLVRVPAHEQFHATRLLDNGAMGIVVPHVSNRVEAERVVSNCLFPPAGRRSVPGGLPQLDFKAVPMAEAIKAINGSMLLVAMIETPEGLENADEIAAVEGIDVLLMGGSDLSAELGIPGETGSPTMRAAFGRIAEACRRYGKFPGLGGVYDHTLMQDYIGAGARFILSGSDLAFLMAGANARASFLRSLPLGAGERADARSAGS